MTVNPPEGWPYPPELDAMTAAPAYHALLFENEHVRVLEAHVGPGETVPSTPTAGRASFISWR